MTALKGAGCKESGRDIWAKPDEDLPTRVIKTFVWETKRILVEWGFDKLGIWADPETGEVWLGDGRVLTGTVKEKELNLDFGKDWEA